MDNTNSPPAMDNSSPKPITINFNGKRIISSDTDFKENSEYLASILEGDNDLTEITITNELFEDSDVMRIIEILLKTGEVQIQLISNLNTTSLISLILAADFLGCTKILNYLKALLSSNLQLRKELFAGETAFEKLADHLIRSLLNDESSDLESARVDAKILLRYLKWKGVEPWVVEALEKRLEEIDRNLEEKKRRSVRHYPDISHISVFSDDESDDGFGLNLPRSIPRAIPRRGRSRRSLRPSHFARTHGNSEISEWGLPLRPSGVLSRSPSSRNEDIEDVNDQIAQQIMEETKAQLDEINGRITQQIIEEIEADLEKDRKDENNQDDEEQSP